MRFKSEKDYRAVTICIRLALPVAAAMIVTLVVANGLLAMTERRSASLPEPKSEPQVAGKHLAGDGDFHEPLVRVLAIPGVTSAKLDPIEEQSLSDDTEVVGVEVDGQPCAFVLDALASKDSHVVNAVINDQAVSVSYCNLSECIRVFGDDSSSQPLSLGVGGLDEDWNMVLMLADNRYGQRSKEIPLQDVEHERTTLGEWKESHPDSLLYCGE